MSTGEASTPAFLCGNNGAAAQIHYAEANSVQSAPEEGYLTSGSYDLIRFNYFAFIIFALMACFPAIGNLSYMTTTRLLLPGTEHPISKLVLCPLPTLCEWDDRDVEFGENTRRGVSSLESQSPPNQNRNCSLICGLVGEVREAERDRRLRGSEGQVNVTVEFEDGNVVVVPTKNGLVYRYLK